jgi:hypothetical protein
MIENGLSRTQVRFSDKLSMVCHRRLTARTTDNGGTTPAITVRRRQQWSAP